MRHDCICASLPDLANVPMGGAGLDTKLLATLKLVKEHGGDQWWLYLGKCDACGQNWMVAEDQRIFDEHFLKRLTPAEADQVETVGLWPDEFLTYESVLRIGGKLARPCRFLDPLDSSLVWTVEDLRRHRPDIKADEIAKLLGIDAKTIPDLIARSNEGREP